MEKSTSKNSDPKTLSLFQTNELFVHKILSRNSSVGSTSSRSYFGRVVGAVPFQWEARPGKPKLDAHKEEPQRFDDYAAELPMVIGSHPAAQSPSMNMARHINYSGLLTNSRLRSFWKKLKKNHIKVKKKNCQNTHKVHQCNNNVNGLEQFCQQADLCMRDEEYMKFCSCGSLNSFSSASTTSASSSASAMDALANFQPSKIQRLARGFKRWAF
ncbi:hypothetical protein D8674_010414 [Pyrus ussuriensis x Pyrus communis]|uniref:Uncharacterized protein n=1 Tax=Pyrus ussuriensis x Pyrus communis TaxID=2448454 RepID=A0A5N5FBD0_9ROSA|nr:hypothetical protein D8674_010414 [Pyrus ussuriensis x Pyrus communis]